MTPPGKADRSWAKCVFMKKHQDSPLLGLDVAGFQDLILCHKSRVQSLLRVAAQLNT